MPFLSFGRELKGLGLHSIPLSPQETRITLKVWGEFVKFLVDTGASHSVLTEPFQPGTIGKTPPFPWTTSRVVDLVQGTVTHSLITLGYLHLLIGKDLLQKLLATIGEQLLGKQLSLL